MSTLSVSNITGLTDLEIGGVDIDATIIAAFAAANSAGGNLTLASGDILYANATPALTNLAKGTDGQVLTLASGLPSWADASGGDWVDLGDVTTNSTSHTVSGIPATATELLIIFSAIVDNTSSLFDGNLQIGDSGGIETTGYFDGDGGESNSFDLPSATAGESGYGVLHLIKFPNEDTWVHAGNNGGNIDVAFKTLSGTLTQLRITAGTSFASGTMKVAYR